MATAKEPAKLLFSALAAWEDEGVDIETAKETARARLADYAALRAAGGPEPMVTTGGYINWPGDRMSARHPGDDRPRRLTIDTGGFGPHNPRHEERPVDLRDTSDFGWTNKQLRENLAVLGDLEAEVVTQTRPTATRSSAAVRVLNRIEGREAVFGLDGSLVDSAGWHFAPTAELAVLKAAGDLLDRWAADPSPLKSANLY